MDMTKATVQDGDGVTVPTGKAATENSNAQIVSGPTQDNDWTGALHAAAMCGAFVMIFPIGVVMLRVLEKVMFHAGVQALGVLVSIVGVAIGLYLSMMYNHVSQHFVASHFSSIALVLKVSTTVQTYQLNPPNSRPRSPLLPLRPTQPRLVPSPTLQENTAPNPHGQNPSLRRSRDTGSRRRQRLPGLQLR